MNKRIYVDAAVIGSGILGCFAARNLRRWNISTLLIEENCDVCTGITRANYPIVYAGYDNKTGSLKAEMTVQANAFVLRANLYDRSNLQLTTSKLAV